MVAGTKAARAQAGAPGAKPVAPPRPQPSSPGASPRAEAGQGDGLRRELNLFGAVSMIVGIVIGSGIFLSVNRLPAGAGSPALIVLAWTVGGLMTLAGALTYAELGVLFPRAGGEYVFLKEGLGGLVAFLSGWVAFTINLAGSAAALAVVFADQLFRLTPGGTSSHLFSLGPIDFTTSKLFAIPLIGVLSIVNYYGIRLGGNVQKLLTTLKVALLLFLAIVCIVYMGPSTTPRSGLTDYQFVDTPQTHGNSGWANFLGLSMVAVLFAYDGWTNVVRVGSEIKDPGRNLPKAMLFGVLAIAGLYIVMSFGYLNVLGFQGFGQSPKTVASDAAKVLFGDAGQAIVATMILVSVAGSLNGITISGPRIYYAMAKDRLFPSTFAKTNRHDVPGRAIAAQAGIAILFLLFFDFDQLTDSVVFVSFLFYALAAIGLLVLRRKYPDLPRPYKVPGYPFVPLAFIVASLAFVGYLAYDQFANFGAQSANRIAGLGIVALGVPVYFYFERRKRRAGPADVASLRLR